MLLHFVAALVTILLPAAKTKHSATGKYSSRNFNSIDHVEDKPGDGSLLDLQNFQYLIKPDSKRVCTENLYLLIMIHSKPENFEERDLIRQTWGSVSSHNNLNIKLTFVMGQFARTEPNKSEKQDKSDNSIKSRSLDRNGFFKSSKVQSDHYKTDAVEKLITLESILHNDIIQGNFVDDIRNLTYKHVMAYKWATEECHHQPTFVLKTDDNVFVEIFHLINFLSGVYGHNPGPSLVCDVVPAGTAPHKNENQNLILESFREQLFPKYCSGSAYLITPSLMPTFLKATNDVAPVAVDDVYMMGMVREYLGISPFYLNIRYSYGLDRPYKWLLKKNLLPMPYLFVVSDPKNKRDWSDTARKLWRKTVYIQRVQNIK